MPRIAKSCPKLLKHRAADCASDSLLGSITAGADVDTYSFVVTGLKTCVDRGGATIAGSFAGCFK